MFTYFQFLTKKKGLETIWFFMRFYYNSKQWFFFKFVKVGWQSSTRGLSQIWLHVLETSRIKITFRITLICWWHVGAYCLNMTTSDFSPHIVVIWTQFFQPIFFSLIICIICPSIFFSSQVTKIRQQKNTSVKLCYKGHTSLSMWRLNIWAVYKLIREEHFYAQSFNMKSNIFETVFQMWMALVMFCPSQKPNFIEGHWKLQIYNLWLQLSNEKRMSMHHPKETWHDFKWHSIRLLTSHSTTTSKVTKKRPSLSQQVLDMVQELISQGYDWIQNGYWQISLTLKNSHPKGFDWI
jgi:hypothetical protein